MKDFPGIGQIITYHTITGVAMMGKVEKITSLGHYVHYLLLMGRQPGKKSSNEKQELLIVLVPVEPFQEHTFVPLYSVRNLSPTEDKLAEFYKQRVEEIRVTLKSGLYLPRKNIISGGMKG